WEAEIDKLMAEQAGSQDRDKRKVYFDRVQQIAADKVPIVFLVNPNALSALSPNVKNVTPAVLAPQIYWNVERLQVGNATVSQARTAPVNQRWARLFSN